MWIFGYASLLWKVDFPYEYKVIGFINGYKRRFWQFSTDHRGMPGNPGRVATLVDDPNALVWGAAYKICESKVEEVRKHLDHRERGGYTSVEVLFNPRDKNRGAFPIMLYVGEPNNPNYAGPAEEKDIAEVIKRSVGPSGENREYLLNLAEYVRNNIPEDNDNHLFRLEVLVKS